MIVPTRQRAELPVKALAAGVVHAGLAPAVAAPVAEALNEYLERGLIGQHSAALPHGDMVRGVEAHRSDVAEGADLLALPRGPERVAGILDQPKVVLLAEGRDRFHVEDIAQGVGDHDGLGLFAARLFELGDVDLVAGQGDIDKDRDAAILQNRIHRRRKACPDGDYFIARLDLPVAQLG